MARTGTKTNGRETEDGNLRGKFSKNCKRRRQYDPYGKGEKQNKGTKENTKRNKKRNKQRSKTGKRRQQKHAR